MDSWRHNPDELLARWRKRTSETPRVTLAEAIIWDIADAKDPRSAALVIRPWEGELLLSLSTIGDAPTLLLRRPWLAPDEPHEPEHD